ncbi:antitoxin Xre/MbcA/ParS toxin-binding domain-containing protein [Sphingomonas silueang]|uniref:antitoxin Xre/MbcA/ParS toxin-binding domain-containing protein n=1 Tax=Sphingomonas silueang TaxID=3156617 RepID=UPI0032B4CE74
MSSIATEQSVRATTHTPAFPYAGIFHASPVERIRLIRQGVSARKVKHFINELHFDQQVMMDALNLKTATVNKKAVRDQPLSIEDGERVIGLARLVGQVEAMVEEAGGAPGFDTAAWLSAWLREPLPALGDDRPIDLLDTMEGQALVSRTLMQIQGGAYA